MPSQEHVSKMEAFRYEGLPGKVVFGSGTLLRIGEEADALGLKRLFVLSTPDQADQAARASAILGARAVGSFSGARMHTPVEVTEAAVDALKKAGADGVVAIGGGSTTGLGKAIALRTGVSQITIPTTYAGSEATPILGETRDGRKETIRDPRILPECVVYDVELTLGLPVAMSVTSGFNAVAHAAEALYAQQRSPLIEIMAEQGARALLGALPRIVAAPRDAAARSDALYGAWLCGICLGSVGMSLHHKLCHVLGGSFDLPHAELHTVLLPYALAYNLPAAPRAAAVLGSILETDDVPATLHALAGSLGAPTSLRAIGMPEQGVGRAVEEALRNPYWNPRPLERQAIEALIANAWVGLPPSIFGEA